MSGKCWFSQSHKQQPVKEVHQRVKKMMQIYNKTNAKIKFHNVLLVEPSAISQEKNLKWFINYKSPNSYVHGPMHFFKVGRVVLPSN